MFAKLGVITRTRKKFAEIVNVAERYLFIQHARNKETKKYPLRIYVPVKLADGKISMKKEKISLYLIYKIVSLSEMAGKTGSFLRKKG